MKMLNYSGKSVVQILVILVVGLCVAFFFYMPGYAEAPNLGPLLVHVLNPISGDPVLPDTFPLPGIPSTKINIFACRGEYEPASIVFRSDSLDVRNLTFAVSDLIGEGGNISKSNVDIRVIKVWYQGGGGWNTLRISYLGKTKVLVPELLLKDDGLVQVDAQTQNNYLRLKGPSGTKLVSVSEPDSLRERVQASIEDFPIHDAVDLQPITLRRNEAKQLWVTVHVPENATPGKYTGSISVMDDRSSLGELQIHLQVLPVHLQAPRIQYSIYYRGTLSENPTISSEHKGYDQFVAELKNMQAHGVTNPAVYQRLDRQALSRVLDIRNGVGLDTSALFYLGTGTGNPQTKEELVELRRRAEVVKDIAKKHGIESVYLYGIDEAKGERLATQRMAWESVHQEGIKVFTAGYSDAFPVAGDLLDLLVMAGKLQRGQAENFHRAGHKIFSYANPQTGPENPEIFRRNYGLELWRNDYDGAMPYAYQDSMGFIWNDFDHDLYRDHTFTYPTVDGVIDTLAWEGFREGVDDVRYITTLEDMLNQFPTPDSPPAREAKRFVDGLRAFLPSNLGEVRSTMVYHLLQLSSNNSTERPPSPRGLQVH
jgi:hypothetical protein